METIKLDHKNLPKNLPETVCCIGYFDGIHKGHQLLIEKAVQLAREQGLKPGLITFDPDPWVIFQPQANQAHLMSIEDKMQIAEKLGIEVFYIFHFSLEFSALSRDEFHQLLYDCGVRTLVCGLDFHYGCKNSGNVLSLKSQKLFDVEVIDPLMDEGRKDKISSSAIERLIEAGAVDEAAWLLGRYYSVSGHIVHGYRRGSTLLHFPTANLQPSDHYIIPKEGVYLGYVSIQSQNYWAMISIGTNPTFENRKETIEAHIFDFDQNIYNMEVRFYFCQFIRENVKFDSIHDLIAQLKLDQQECRRLIAVNGLQPDSPAFNSGKVKQ